MFCSTCGTENDDTTQACQSCGAAFAQAGPAEGATPPPAASGMDPTQERTWAMLCHLLAIFAGVIGALVMWLIKKDESAYVDYHGKESVNFQISLIIYSVVCSILIFAFIGLLLLPALMIFAIVVMIQGAIAANNGQYYRYPLSIRFIK